MHTIYKFCGVSLLIVLSSFLTAWSGQSDYNSDSKVFKVMGSVISDFLVNDDTGTASQGLPDIAVDGKGNFVITWSDNRDTNWHIYAQRYDYQSMSQEANFRVDDDTGSAWYSFPAIAMSRSGSFVIVWEDYRSSFRADIYAQRYSSTGDALGSNFRVNDDTSARGQYRPAIAMDISGDFVVTWFDYRNGHPDIYAQRYISSGTAIGFNFKVNDDSTFRYQYRPDIAMDASGKFIITWEDSRNEDLWVTDIYAQRYSSEGIPLGSNFQVSYDGGSVYQWEPCVALNNSGSFVIAWRDDRGGYCNIYAQRFDSSGSALDSNFRINDVLGAVSLSYPSTTMDGYGNFVIAWTDTRNENYDVYAQKYDFQGLKLGSNYLVPDSLFTSLYQANPAVVSTGSELYFTWQDGRRGNPDIYAKILDWNSTKIEENQEMNLPNRFVLCQNYPNPFNPICIIEYTLPMDCKITLSIHNILGQKVKVLVNEYQNAGHKSVRWDGRNNQGREVAGGVYFYSIQAGDFEQTKKMVLLK